MSNHKKTRQQKIIADLHRKLQSVSPATKSIEANSDQKSLPVRPSFSLAFTPSMHTPQRTISYAYIGHDLKKIVLVTMGIVFFESVLFFLLKNHILVLPFVQF